MAGDWIKMQACLPDKPEVWAIANITGCDPDAVIGKLLRVWAWFDTHTEDGNAVGVTFALLDRIAGVTGFADAMKKCGWLDSTESGVSLPHFSRHNGKTAKTRAITNDRVAKSREMKRECNASTVTESVTREEKRREDNKHTTASPVGFAEFWTAYPRKKGKAEAEKAFAKAIKLTDLDTLLLAIKLQSSELKWHDKANERYIPHPATWLNARRWEDSAPQKPADPSVPHEGWRNARGKPAIRFWGEWRDPDGIDPKSGNKWSLVKFTHEKCIYPGRDCSEPIGE